MRGWVKLRSWHEVRLEPTDQFAGKALCGRKFNGANRREATFPESEKTCESCLRASAKVAS